LLTLLAGTGQEDSAKARLGIGPGIFELILRALADHSDALADLDRLVQRLPATEQGRAVLPDGFETLWPIVIAAHARLPRGAG